MISKAFSGSKKGPYPILKVQDLVNRTLWKVCTFSGDGEYICAGSAKQHQIYIWERTATQQTAGFVKILEVKMANFPILMGV